jgi:hypothetical protein
MLYLFDKDVGLFSLLDDFNHLNFELFLKSHDLVFGFVQNLETQCVSLDLSVDLTFLVFEQGLIE